MPSPGMQIIAGRWEVKLRPVVLTQDHTKSLMSEKAAICIKENYKFKEKKKTTSKTSTQMATKG